MFRRSRVVVLSAVLGSLVGGHAFAVEPVAGQPVQSVEQKSTYKSVLTPQQVSAEIADPNVIVIDVRDADAYAKGHLPGAISLPGKVWRTPSSNPQEKLGQYIFRNEAGELDVARYEKLLSDAGVNTGQRVIIYGSHAGKADGSTPVAILLLLGHENVGFLDGNGAAEWEKAGYSLDTTPNTRPAGKFVARPNADKLWDIDQVKQAVASNSAVFFDVRSKAEFEGTDLRGNRRGGHIPGAINLDFDHLLDKQTKKILPADQAREKIAALNLPTDKPIVLYCQTATRTSLLEIVLRELGYDNVVVYDASWQEYGNRDDTEIALPGSRE